MLVSSRSRLCEREAERFARRSLLRDRRRFLLLLLLLLLLPPRTSFSELLLCRLLPLRLRSGAGTSGAVGAGDTGN